MRSTTLNRFREEQKALASAIRTKRAAFKASQRAGDPNYSLYYGFRHDASDYRHRHIAYCLAKGTSMELIEKPREGNEHSQTVVDGILKTIREEMAREVAPESAAAA